MLIPIVGALLAAATLVAALVLALAKARRPATALAAAGLALALTAAGLAIWTEVDYRSCLDQLPRGVETFRFDEFDPPGCTRSLL